jgi:hypothetical protein
MLKKGLKAFLDNEIGVLTENSNKISENQTIDFNTLTDLSFEEETNKTIELALSNRDFIDYLGQ